VRWIIQTFLSTRKLDVSTYIKPINKQAYIHATSFHPKGTSKGVIIEETKRVARTNSRFDTFLQFKDKHKMNLLKRGYSHKFIDQQMKIVKFSNRSQELKHIKHRIGNSNRVTFATRYSNVATKVMGVIGRILMKPMASKIMNSLFLFSHLEKA